MGTDTNDFLAKRRRYLRHLGIIFLLGGALYMSLSSIPLVDRAPLSAAFVGIGIAAFLPLRALKVLGTLAATTALCGLVAAALCSLEAGERLCYAGGMVWFSALINRLYKDNAMKVGPLDGIYFTLRESSQEEDPGKRDRRTRAPEPSVPFVLRALVIAGILVVIAAFVVGALWDDRCAGVILGVCTCYGASVDWWNERRKRRSVRS